MIIMILLAVTVDRLADFTVSVGNRFNPLDPDDFDPSEFSQCVHVPGQLGLGETRTILCDEPVMGQFVAVYVNKTEYLTICEFEVHRLKVPGNQVGSFKRVNLNNLLSFEKLVMDPKFGRTGLKNMI